MADEIASIGVEMPTGGVERGIRTLEALAAQGPKVEQSMDRVSKAADKAGKAIGGMGAGTVSQGLDSVAKSAAPAATAMSRAGDAAASMGSSLRGAAAASGEAAAKAAQAVNALSSVRQAIVAIGLTFLTREFIQTADAVTVLNTQLRLATGGTAQAAAAYQSLYDIAQRSRVSFTELGATYASIARATGELGISQQRMLKVTESIANAMAVGGGSATAMQAALIQLSQGMAAGVLRGEELNSVMEQTPRLAKALADGLGVPIGKLREMGQAGELTAQKVVAALESQSAVLAKEVAGATLTVSQAFTQLTNASTRAVGDFDKASGASETLAKAISAVASAVEEMGSVFRNNEGIITATLGALSGAAAAAGIATLPRAIGAVGTAVAALGSVLMANPAVLALLGIGAVVGGGVALVNAYKQTADGIKATIDALEKENERAKKALDWTAEMGPRYQKGDDETRRRIDERTAAIRKLRQELALIENKNLDTRAEDSRFAASTAAMAEQTQAASELAAIRQKLFGVDKDYLPTLQKLHAQYQAGKLSLAEYQALVAKLAQANYKPEKQTAGLKGENTAYQSLISSIRQKIGVEQASIQSSVKLTESEKIALKLNDDLASGKLKLTAAQEAQVRAALMTLEAYEKEQVRIRGLVREYQSYLDIQQELIAGQARLNAEQDRARQTVWDYVRSVEESTRLLDLEASLIGKTERERKIAVEQLRIELDLKRKLAEVDAAYFEGGDEAREAERARLRAAAAKDSANAVTRATLDEFNRINDQIGQSLADALMEGGKSAWEYIKGLFRSQVLAPIIKAVIQPITGSIASMVTGSPAGGSGGGSWMNNLGTIGSAAQAMWGLSAGASTASLAAANAVGMAGGDALGALIAGNGGWAGVSAGAGATAAGTAMSTLAAAAPWIAAAVAIVSILSNQNKWSGQFGETQVRNGRASDVDSRSTFTNSSYSAEMSKAASTVGESIAQTIAAFGGASSDLILRQFSATASKKDRAQAGFDGFVNGQFFSTGSIEVSKDQQAQAFADQALRATVLALQSTVEGRFGEYFDSVNALEADIPDLQALLETAAAVQQFGKQVEWLGGVFDSLGGLGVQVTADLATAAGGFDALTSSLSSAYQVLYTEEERLAFLTDDVSAAFQKLGVEMPLSADEYRAALEAAEDGLASGADGADKLYATLLQLAPAWGQVADAAKQAAQEALEAQMDAVKRQMDDITSQYGDVAGAMRELESPAMTLVDAWRQTRSELERLDDVLGGGVLDGLDGLISQFTGLRSVRQSLDQQILDLQLQAAGPNAASFLRQREATLWAQINGGGDIAGASEELARVIAQRVQLESQAVQDSTQVRIDAEIAVKEAALEAYRQQIEAIERIQDTVRSLLIGDLSPLSPGRRAAEAGSQYRDVLARAQGGDVQALQDLPNMAQEYLRQAQQFGNPQAYARQFYEVLGQLQGLGVDGPGLDQRESELDVLREQRDALADNTRILSETASAQINLLTVLRDRVAAEEAQRRAQLEEERATREALKEGQEAQIRQQAAIFEGMQQELEALNTSVNEIAERVGTIVNRPT